MRTGDYTYLAKLGFADKDRQNPLHDDTCMYLLQREKVEKILKSFGEPLIYGDQKLEIMSPKISEPIIKYAAYGRTDLVGFYDVICPFAIKMPTTVNGHSYLGNSTYAEHAAPYEAGSVIIEVKSGYTSVANMIQQMNTYRQIDDIRKPVRDRVKHVIATNFPMDAADIELLKSHGIGRIYVSPKDVEDYKKNQKTAELDKF